jgi:hypothetical protein
LIYKYYFIEINDPVKTSIVTPRHNPPSQVKRMPQGCTRHCSMQPDKALMRKTGARGYTAFFNFGAWPVTGHHLADLQSD